MQEIYITIGYSTVLSAIRYKQHYMILVTSHGIGSQIQDFPPKSAQTCKLGFQ